MEEARPDLAENACPECQGSAYVPGPMYDGRMVDECPECKGTGKDATKKAARRGSYHLAAGARPDAHCGHSTYLPK